MSLGEGVFGGSSITFTHTATGGQYTALFITNTGHSATCCLQRIEANPSPLMKETTYFKNAAGNGGPTAGKPCRVGVTITNTTKALDRQGAVYSWVCNSRLAHDPATSTVGALSAWAQEAVNLPGVTMHSAEQLAERPLHVYGYPNDQSAYDSFEEWVGVESASAFSNHISIAGSAAKRPMSTIIIIFGYSAGTVSTYQVQVHCDWYHRFAVGDSRTSYSAPIPTAPAPLINAQRDAAERSGGRGSFRRWGPVKAFEKAFDNAAPDIMGGFMRMGAAYGANRLMSSAIAGTAQGAIAL